MPQREGTAVDTWIAEHRELIEQIVELEGMVKYGSIEIVYVNSNPVGIDLHAKQRLQGVDKHGNPMEGEHR